MNQSQLPYLDIGFWFPRPERGAKLAQELRAQGHQVTIYHSLPIPGDQTWVRQVRYGRLSGLLTILKLKHDVFYTSHSFTPVLQLLLNKWIRRKPYIYTLNGVIWSYYQERNAPIPLVRAKNAFYGALLQAVVGGAGAVVANSEFLANQLKARLPRHATKISTIYNGIDYETIDQAVAAPTAWDGGEPRLLSVLTLNFEGKTRGALLLLDAFEEIARRYPKASYVIAAKSASPKWLALIESHRQNLDCIDQIKIEVNRTDVSSLLAAASLFMYATSANSSDSLPRALLEAQAAGVPIVTTDTTGCAEVVADGETGKVVPEDFRAMAAAAIALLDDRDKAGHQSAAGAIAVRERFNWAAMGIAYSEAFVHITDRSPLLP